MLTLGQMLDEHAGRRLLKTLISRSLRYLIECSNVPLSMQNSYLTTRKALVSATTVQRWDKLVRVLDFDSAQGQKKDKGKPQGLSSLVPYFASNNGK